MQLQRSLLIQEQVGSTNSSDEAPISKRQEVFFIVSGIENPVGIIHFQALLNICYLDYVCRKLPCTFNVVEGLISEDCPLKIDRRSRHV